MSRKGLEDRNSSANQRDDRQITGSGRGEEREGNSTERQSRSTTAEQFVQSDKE